MTVIVVDRLGKKVTLSRVQSWELQGNTAVAPMPTGTLEVVTLSGVKYYYLNPVSFSVTD